MFEFIVGLTIGCIIGFVFGSYGTRPPTKLEKEEHMKLKYRGDEFEDDEEEDGWEDEEDKKE